MKKALFFVFVFVFVNVCAEDYGIKVGGVSVTSSNCDNVTGSNIKAYDESKSFSVKYVPSTNTLTLRNVKIERTGSGNRAIYNTGCKNLTVVLDGKNYLYAKNAAPVRFEHNSTIKCQNIKTVKDCQIIGVDEDAIYLAGSNISLTLDNAALYVTANNSSCIVGKEGSEKVYVKNSSLWVYCNNADCDEYAFFDIKVLDVRFSDIKIEVDKAPMTKNLEMLTIYSGMTYLPIKTSSGYKKVSYSSVMKEFESSGYIYRPTTVMLCSNAIAINETNFPDKAFREYLLATGVGADGYLVNKNAYGNTTTDINFIYDETTKTYRLSLNNKKVASLSGIEHFTSLKELYCRNNKLTTLDLSQNKKLTYVACDSNALTSLTLPATAPLKELYCQNNKLTSLTMPETTVLKHVDCYDNNIQGNNLKTFITSLPQTEGGIVNLVNHSVSTEKNTCTAQHVAQAAKKGWTLQHYYNGSWAPTSQCPHIYKLTYLIDGEQYKTLNIEEGAKITPLANTEDDDYYYAWEDEPTTMPAHDVEVHAVITSIAPLLSGGAGGRPVNVYYDLQGREVTNPVKGNIYILNGKKIIYK